MNRDYSVRLATVPAGKEQPLVLVEIPDYLVVVCAVFLLPGNVEPVRDDWLVSYAHFNCLDRTVDNVEGV